MEKYMKIFTNKTIQIRNDLIYLSHITTFVFINRKEDRNDVKRNFRENRVFDHNDFQGDEPDRLCERGDLPEGHAGC